MKRDWTEVDCMDGAAVYALQCGNRACDILAFGTWREHCQLRYYCLNTSTNEWMRCKRDGTDWYAPIREDAEEYATCSQAEKVALEWLKEGAE